MANNMCVDMLESGVRVWNLPMGALLCRCIFIRWHASTCKIYLEEIILTDVWMCEIVESVIHLLTKNNRDKRMWGSCRHLANKCKPFSVTAELYERSHRCEVRRNFLDSEVEGRCISNGMTFRPRECISEVIIFAFQEPNIRGGRSILIGRSHGQVIS